jgi:hypothetical protein
VIFSTRHAGRHFAERREPASRERILEVDGATARPRGAGGREYAQLVAMAGRRSPFSRASHPPPPRITVDPKLKFSEIRHRKKRVSSKNPFFTSCRSDRTLGAQPDALRYEADEVSNAALYVAGACSVSAAGLLSLSPACPDNATAALSIATVANIDFFMQSPSGPAQAGHYRFR